MKIVLRSHEYPPDKFSVVQFVETKTRSHFEATLPIVFMVSRTVSRVSARAPSIMNQVTGIFFVFKRFAVFIMSSRLKSLARLSSIESQVDSAPISTSLKPASFIRSSSSSSTAPGERSESATSLCLYQERRSKPAVLLKIEVSVWFWER